MLLAFENLRRGHVGGRVVEGELDLGAIVGWDIDHWRLLRLDVAVTEAMEELLNIPFATDFEPFLLFVVLDIHANELESFVVNREVVAAVADGSYEMV